MTAARRRRVTALDVARHAGVSKTTVSYVLNDTPGQSIPRETRDRVLDAVQALEYVPHSGARALRRGHDDTVLLVMPDWPLGRVLALIIDSLGEEMGRQGLSLVIRRQRSGQPLLTMWQQLNPAAIVALGAIEDADQRAIRAAGVFIASALLTAPSGGGPATAFPQEAIGELQVRHLASRGHRRLGWFGPDDARFRVFSDLRIAGAREACAQLELAELDVVPGSPTTSSATAVVRRWADQATPVTGAVAYNDDFAGALLSALAADGRCAPADLAVIGVDNEPLSQFTTPALTTIDQNHQVTAAHLALVVARGLAGEAPPPAPRDQVLTLVERQSS